MSPKVNFLFGLTWSQTSFWLDIQKAKVDKIEKWSKRSNSGILKLEPILRSLAPTRWKPIYFIQSGSLISSTTNQKFATGQWHERQTAWVYQLQSKIHYHEKDSNSGLHAVKYLSATALCPNSIGTCFEHPWILRKALSRDCEGLTPPSLSLNKNKKSPPWNATHATFMLNFRLTEIRLNPRQQQFIKVPHRYRTWIQDTELIISPANLCSLWYLTFI